jgi:hypothetical protein
LITLFPDLSSFPPFLSTIAALASFEASFDTSEAAFASLEASLARSAATLVSSAAFSVVFFAFSPASSVFLAASSPAFSALSEAFPAAFSILSAALSVAFFFLSSDSSAYILSAASVIALIFGLTAGPFLDSAIFSAFLSVYFLRFSIASSFSRLSSLLSKSFLAFSAAFSILSFNSSALYFFSTDSFKLVIIFSTCSIPAALPPPLPGHDLLSYIPSTDAMRRAEMTNVIFII